MKIILFFTALLLAPLAILRADEEPVAAKAQVTVHPETPGIAIPADFLGLSYEKWMLTETHFREGNTEIVNLFRNLGSGVLRIGGNRVESTYWLHAPPPPEGTPAKNAPKSIGPEQLDNFYAFAKKSGWRVIHGVNLSANDPEMSANEAAYAAKVGGTSVLAFEVGNEPDFYPKHLLRPLDYQYAQYRVEAEAGQKAIVAKVPGAALAGPATTKFCTWFPECVADFKGRIALATNHFYSLSAKSTDPKSPNFATCENLLSAKTKASWLSFMRKNQKVSHDAGIPYRLGECNSVSNGGTDGVSDVFASALWGSDFLFDVAEQGVTGINFHGGFGDRGYTPLCLRDKHYRPHPLYYAMLLFHMTAVGRAVPVECQTSANVAVHAVLGDDGKLRVILINKELTQSVSASVAVGAKRTKAELIRLTAPSSTAKEGILLAGSAVAEDGTWTPQAGEPVQAANGNFEVALPAASVAVLIVE